MRRSEFLGVLAALPVVGGLFAKKKPKPSDVWGFTLKDGTRFWVPSYVLQDRARQILESEWRPS